MHFKPILSFGTHSWNGVNLRVDSVSGLQDCDLSFTPTTYTHP